MESVKLDPNRETADINESNNTWGTIAAPSKFTVFKQKQQTRGQSSGINPMQKSEEKKKSILSLSIILIRYNATHTAWRFLLSGHRFEVKIADPRLPIHDFRHKKIASARGIGDGRLYCKILMTGFE